MRATGIGLACALTLALGAPSAVADESFGGWQFTETADPITDAKRVMAVVKGTGGAFALACDKPGPRSVRAHFISDEYLGEESGFLGGIRQVIHRFDEDKSVARPWLHASNIASLADNKQAVLMGQRLRTATKLAIRASDFRGRTYDAVFDVTGGDRAVALVFSACGQQAPSPSR